MCSPFQRIVYHLRLDSPFCLLPHPIQRKRSNDIGSSHESSQACNSHDGRTSTTPICSSGDIVRVEAHPTAIAHVSGSPPDVVGGFVLECTEALRPASFERYVLDLLNDGHRPSAHISRMRSLQQIGRRARRGSSRRLTS